jgi:hypothetical protein
MAHVRFAGPADIDKIVHLAIKAMQFDPSWDYIYARRKEFPDDHYENTKMIYKQFLDPANSDWQVRIVELVLGEIVAFSVWNVSCINRRECGSSYQPQDRLYQVSSTSVPADFSSN